MERVNRSHWMFLIGWLVFCLSWFIRVVSASECRLSEACLPGWEALRVALSPIWAYKDFELDLVWWRQVLVVVTGLTNLTVVFSFVAFLRPSARTFHVIGWGLAGSAFIDMYWLSLLGLELRAGYYLWVISFVVLSVAALLCARRRSTV